ncbi:MAG TPA: S9 family peptidase [Candidatus Avibacteroides excrementipullorum]|nr:S9 family peptidase [Candidatus Avibacteroides excrementipullorum]
MKHEKVKILLCMAMSFLTSAFAMSQQLTIEDINAGQYYARSIRGVTPMNDGEHYTQLSPDNKRIVKYSYKTGKEVGVIFDVETARECNLEKIQGYIFSPDEKRILIETEREPIYRRSYSSVYHLYSVENNKLSELTEGKIRIPVFSPDGNLIAFVRDNNIFLIKLLYGGSESQITKDGEINKVINGAPDWVYEEEFGYNSALTFSPDNKMIAYVRWDESNVKSFEFPMYKGDCPAYMQYAEYPGKYTYKYPVAGEDNSKVSVKTFDIFSKVTRTMQLPIEDDAYIPRIRFTNNPEQLAIMTINRHQNRFDMYYANPRSGVCKLILRDESNWYIKESIYDNIKFYDKYFSLLSEKDGFAHLYWYTINGTLVKQVTQGKFEVKSFLGWDEKSNTFYYVSNEGSPLRTAVWKTDGKGRKTCLSQKEGTNNAMFSAGMKYFINFFNNTETPTEVTINDNNGKTIATLMDNADLKAKVAGMKMPEKEFFTFTTPEGYELNGWMMKPVDFDPSQKYPILMFQYSGPGSQQVLDTWSVSWETYMATQGYIAVCVDGRGTGGRGAAFEKCTYLSIGVKEADDQVSAAKYLGTLPYIDKDRIAIWGWSYGGYMTLMSMSQGSNVFKAGIAVAAPTDWRFYDTVYTERFMRTPQENKEGYDKASAINRIDKLHGKLLMVHGTADDNVHYRNMAEYCEELVQHDKSCDMQIYTNRNHNIMGGNTRNHLYKKLTNYIKENL